MEGKHYYDLETGVKDKRSVRVDSKFRIGWT